MGVQIALCATGALIGGLVVWFALAFCRAAGEADRRMERMRWDELLEKYEERTEG